MKVELYDYAVKAGADPPRPAEGRSKPRRPGGPWRAGRGLGARPAHGAGSDVARRDPRRSPAWHGLAHRCRLAEGRRAVPWRHQGQRGRGRVRRRRADLHGPQQPEPAQLPVPRLPEAVGGLYRRQDQLDRPGAGRLQRAPAAVDRHRHGRFRHHRDGRALRGRHRQQGPARRDARLGQDPDRHGRLRGLPQGRRSAPGTARPTASPSTATATPSPTARTTSATARSAGPTPPTTWQQVNAVSQGADRPDRPADRAAGLRLPRPAEGLGRLRLLLPRGPRHGLCQAPGRSGLAVRPRHDEAARQQPGLGAGDPGRDGPDRRQRLSGRPDQRRPRHHRLLAVPGRHRRRC